MFYDTVDWFSDSNKTKKIKAYRRKSNYYESKSDDLQRSINKLNKLLNRAKSDYRLGSHNITTSIEHVLKYRFYHAETAMFKKTEELIGVLENKKNTVVSEKNKANTLYKKYYNLAQREDD